MSGSPVLFDDAFAPITSHLGFLRAPLDVVAPALTSWRREIHGVAQLEHLPGGLRDHMPHLEPLTSGVRPRELVVATANPEWTAVVDCGFPHGDPVSTVGHLARAVAVEGVVVTSVPASHGAGGRTARRGARQLQLFAPTATEFLNYVRSVSVVQYEGRWRFDANGEVQEFEDRQAYERRKVGERFTSSMLVGYAAALGLRPFDDDFYPGPGVLVRSPAPSRPGLLVLSLREARQRAGIVPADSPVEP
ncbi:hypothetical protein AB6N23_08020 [Cellulomonas sp. 179-A 9B4 NHS]|uniref:hypothetical protein n=1 Tax=Cellulomonas sp. 179-A 9B4 NHS TaxID=3142379 RepID=UPI00399F05AC